MTVVNTPQEVLSYEFIYDGAKRIVDNVAFDGDKQQMVGYEIRKAGKFSFAVKRYSLTKISNLRQIDPVKRVGPIIGRPDEAGR